MAKKFDKTDRILRSLKSRPEIKTPIASDIFLPNLSEKKLRDLREGADADNYHKHNTIKGVEIKNDPTTSGLHLVTDNTTEASWTALAAIPNSFDTIDCPAGTDPVADSGTDTLTLTSANNILGITGDAATDTVDFEISEGNIDHGNIAGLSDDDHTQYALLAGRAGSADVGTTSLPYGTVHSDTGFNLTTAGGTCARIPANSYFAGIHLQPTSGIYFDNVAPKGINLRISGTDKHNFYMGASADQGAVYHLPRDTDPTNVTLSGALYVKNNAGTYELMIYDGSGSWVKVGSL